MNIFSDNVQRLIDSQGISVSSLSRQCGIGRPSLSRILNGHEGVTLERAERIADALGVELADLIRKPKVAMSA